MDRPGDARKLVAVVSADVAGYSRLIAEDEPRTLQALTDSRTLFQQLIEQHHAPAVFAGAGRLLHGTLGAASVVTHK